VIEERKSEHVMSTDALLQPIKEKHRLRERITELERQLELDNEDHLH
jgi:hypothetical protein